MKKHATKPRMPENNPKTEIPPGATRRALDRPLEPEGGPPGSGAGPRHAADDIGSESETFGRIDLGHTPASAPTEDEDFLEIGPTYSELLEGAVGGAPAQARSLEGATESEVDQSDRAPDPVVPVQAAFASAANMIRLTGDAAIEYAEKHGMSLNKHPDSITGPRVGLNIGEAQAIADDDPELIWLDVFKDDYYSGPPTDFEPEA